MQVHAQASSSSYKGLRWFASIFEVVLSTSQAPLGGRGVSERVSGPQHAFLAHQLPASGTTL